MRPYLARLPVRWPTCLAVVCCLATALAQDRPSDESHRERWQKVDEILGEMLIHPGAIVADVGAGDGFFTSRLARAVGGKGRVFAVEIDDAVMDRLRTRLQRDGLANVTVVKGAPDDPRLPDRVLDAALIVNAYHEMEHHQSMLAALRRALKPDGRLVVVEPVRSSRRGRPRADQARDHELDPEYLLQEARAAGFRVVALKDPFTVRDGDIQWLMCLQPDDTPAQGNVPTETAREGSGELKDPSLRISLDEFLEGAAKGAVTIVDVRDEQSFAAGHIPGAVAIPLESIESNAERLRRWGRPVVTYCN